MAFQRFGLLLGQLEHEILRKALNITLHLPIELRSLNIVESGKVTIHDNLLVTHNKNPLLDLLHGRGITNCATLLYRIID